MKDLSKFLHEMWVCGFSKAAASENKNFGAWQTCVIKGVGGSSPSAKMTGRQQQLQQLEAAPDKSAALMARLSIFLHVQWHCGFNKGGSRDPATSFEAWQTCVDTNLKAAEAKQQGALHKPTTEEMVHRGKFLKAMWECGFSKAAAKMVTEFQPWQACVDEDVRRGVVYLKQEMIKFPNNGRVHSHRVPTDPTPTTS